MEESREIEVSLLSEIYDKNAGILLEEAPEFRKLMTWYKCAIMEVETKFRVLNEEFSLAYDANPFESIESRLKSPASILAKLQKNGWPVTVESIEKNLNDVAGIRVVCSFQDDIYKVARMLGSQDDVSVMRIKDYIKNPKDNGYRSLHVIIAIPIFLSNEKKLMKVEVQFRTIAMDFWASLEHKMKYKKNVKNPEMISEKLLNCAQMIHETDLQMQQIRSLIEKK